MTNSPGPDKPKRARTSNPFRKGIIVTVTHEPDQVPINYPRLLEAMENLAAFRNVQTVKEPSPQERDENYDFWAT